MQLWTWGGGLGRGTGTYIKQKISPQFSGSIQVVPVLRVNTPKYNNVKAQKQEQLQPCMAQLPVWCHLKPAAPFAYLLSGDSDSKESACNAGDLGLIPGLGRSTGEGNGTHSSILAWKMPLTEDPGGLKSMGSQRIGHD